MPNHMRLSVSVLLAIIVNLSLLIAPVTSEELSKLDRALEKFNRTGEIRSCLSTRRFNGFKALDDRHLIIRYSPRVSYLSKLPARCSGLRFHESIAYRSFANRICKTDTFSVLKSGYHHGPRCGFGPFEKLERKPKAKTKPE